MTVGWRLGKVGVAYRVDSDAVDGECHDVISSFGGDPTLLAKDLDDAAAVVDFDAVGVRPRSSRRRGGLGGGTRGRQ